MRVVVVGGSGMVGSRVVKELALRGHQVIAVARNPEKIVAGAGVSAVKGDLNDAAGPENTLRGADAVVSAPKPPQGQEQEVIPASGALLDAARKAGVKRVIVVGGAASLFVAPGVTLLSSGHLPAEWHPIAKAHADLLDLLRTTDLGAGLDWTDFSPAGFIQPGERTGKFRVGKTS
jgi:putative NADH-flavin reductase